MGGAGGGGGGGILVQASSPLKRQSLDAVTDRVTLGTQRGGR